MAFAPVLIIFPICLAYAALNDIKCFKIPNWISIVLVAVYPIAALACGASIDLVMQSFLIGAAALLIGFALFAFNILGGGDAKLFAASALWIGLSGAAPFLLWLALSGGVLSILILLFRATPVVPAYVRFDWMMRLHQSENGVPYGVAIAIGGFAALPHTALFGLAFGI
ncbi:MAG: prepilin peptidase [Pseudomonadota bacterium]